MSIFCFSFDPTSFHKLTVVAGCRFSTRLFFAFYIHPFLWTPLMFNLICWAVSCSLLFSVTFFLPMLVVPCAVYCACWLGLRWFRTRLERVEVAEDAAKCTLAWWHKLLFTNLQDSVWFFKPKKNNPFEYLLLIVSFLATFFVVLGPVLVYGVWMAAYAYSEHTPEENMALAALAYKYTYGLFIGIKWHIPALEFDVALAAEASSIVTSVYSSLIHVCCRPSVLTAISPSSIPFHQITSFMPAGH